MSDVRVLIRDRIGDRALVAVEGGEMEGEIEFVLEGTDDGVIGDAAFNEGDAVVGGEVGSFRGKEVVDDGDVIDAVGEESADEIGADESGASDDEAGRFSQVQWFLLSLQSWDPWCC